MKNDRLWQPRPNDAIDLATLRWYAVTIEKLAIEIYVTDRSKFGALDTVLRREVKALTALAARASDAVHSDDDCPGGWFLCRDGLCAPACDSPANLAAAKKKKTR